ncbi:hypothetical protein SCLARK_001178 [Spiroplasma clarkii]|uniref:Uncharacterized protein n=1 Tax=Spiroplasma clarkii TaxID=2139 RepID=A0A1Y0L175_9MOLU|nr:ABC transporter permease subunit [Spiroplasma clarkii]ARU91736.1 hypothetical protein SCLARK_001178 [Spiroplasma clarkii]ATX71116.1 hypothetical protein SCLAR_v1c08030 [Spiroplasma clarkii]
METFKFNNKILAFHLKMAWKWILFFGIVAIFATSAAMLFAQTVPGEVIQGPYIARIFISENTAENGSNYLFIETSQSGVINGFLFTAPSLLILGIISTVFINDFILKEINQGKILSWLTFAVSRKQVILLKIIAINVINLILTCTMSIIIMVFCALAVDANQYFGRVVLYCFNFILFNLVFTTILALAALYMTEKIRIFNLLVAIILLYLFITWFLYFVVYVGQGGDIQENAFRGLKAVKYFSIQSFIVNPLDFTDKSKTVENIVGDYFVVTEVFELNQKNEWLLWFGPIAYLGVLASTGYLCAWKFTRAEIMV